MFDSAKVNLAIFFTVFKGQFLKKLTLLESFKVVPLFSYQGPLCCLPTGATLISYHVFSGLSTTFLIIFLFFWKQKRRKRDLNPRAALTTYTLSRGASSASWVFLQIYLLLNLSPHSAFIIILTRHLFVNYFFIVFKTFLGLFSDYLYIVETLFEKY